MNIPYTRAPHQGESGSVHTAAAPNAALLIDFDNVTMGMRSDLSKDLKKLLQSEIIRGKVTVQRAYADWRRYPQYIVPLSENSIDLIFAPAYGSSKKNATDIRMAIDGMELVFTRPEIGTYILLTGDSDFSSLVLKLKEYGKYVIGVGIQESSSDILVQNCDEYYSYTNLAGLTKTNETGQKAQDPWILVEKAVKRMAERNDVMRSDRLKQVMLELDPAFDEGNFGFSKFSRFVTEAASRDLVRLKKMDNGQYEIRPAGGAGGNGDIRGRRTEERGRGRKREERRPSRRDEGDGRRSRQESREPAPQAVPKRQQPAAEAPLAPEGADSLRRAYGLLRRAVQVAGGDEREAVRDSDVKRKMLDIEAGFDEAELGFSKFSRFLRQAHDHEVIDLHKRDSGNYEVSLGKVTAERAVPAGGTAPAEGRDQPATGPATAEGAASEAPREKAAEASGAEARPPAGEAPSATRSAQATPKARLGLRRGSARGREAGDEAPPIFEGQVVEAPSDQDKGPASDGAPAGTTGEGLDMAALGLPTDADAAKRYLANSYKGVGVKTAETLVETLGDDIFQVLHSEPDRIYDVIPANRAQTLLDAWEDDLRRRQGSVGETTHEDAAGGGGGRSGGRRRTRRGGRRRS